ncbi:Ig-like domain-containing protein [Anaeromicropila populeti]|uniref:Ig-like domain (Group 2) n=1 Tax=Anaeromicropila populeti TaxID=37658 RepID=A0A1I6J1D9_9FIRM|nr:Ig-like domain-containing protein [Anaeromicropila populeti]SFR72749.1 Ig-like domain (group 2) [Anaeromicropila populeti]
MKRRLLPILIILNIFYNALFSPNSSILVKAADPGNNTMEHPKENEERSQNRITKTEPEPTAFPPVGPVYMPVFPILPSSPPYHSVVPEKPVIPQKPVVPPIETTEPNTTTSETAESKSAYLSQVTVAPTKETIYLAQTSKLSLRYPKQLSIGDIKITYTSNDKNILSVSKKGVVTAKHAGIGKITATISICGKSKRVVSRIVVKKPYISFTKKVSSLSVRKTYTFQAVGFGYADPVQYSVSDQRIASINKISGKFTAKRKGTVYVIAKTGSSLKKYKVRIK